MIKKPGFVRNEEQEPREKRVAVGNRIRLIVINQNVRIFDNQFYYLKKKKKMGLDKDKDEKFVASTSTPGSSARVFVSSIRDTHSSDFFNKAIEWIRACDRDDDDDFI